MNFPLFFTNHVNFQRLAVKLKHQNNIFKPHLYKFHSSSNVVKGAKYYILDMANRSGQKILENQKN